MRLQNGLLACITTAVLGDDRWPMGLEVWFAHQKRRIAIQHVAGAHGHNASSNGTWYVWHEIATSNIRISRRVDLGSRGVKGGEKNEKAVLARSINECE